MRSSRLTKKTTFESLRLSTIGGKYITSSFNDSAEYDHPCVVNKSRKKPAETINDEYKEYNDWSKFRADSHINALMKQDSLEPNRPTEDLSRLSKIRAANDALRAKIKEHRDQY